MPCLFNFTCDLVVQRDADLPRLFSLLATLSDNAAIKAMLRLASIEPGPASHSVHSPRDDGDNIGHSAVTTPSAARKHGDPHHSMATSTSSVTARYRSTLNPESALHSRVRSRPGDSGSEGSRSGYATPRSSTGSSVRFALAP